MSIVRHYNAGEVIVTWGELTITRELVEGTFVTAARTSARNSQTIGASGDATIVVNNNRSGVVEITVSKASGVNATLSDVAKAQELPGARPAAKPLEIADFGGSTLHKSPKAILEGFPEDEFAQDEGSRTWRFLCPVLAMDPRESLQL